MNNTLFPFEEVKEKIAQAQSITILTHINPDGDTLGTALGIYALLIKEKGKKVEVVNASKDLPRYLDFLPYYEKIKHKMEYGDSLIISCDCGSVDRLGFDVTGRDILNIDHHKSNTMYGSINVVLDGYASASQVAYQLFEPMYDISAKVATCFYTALFSDTLYFTTNLVNDEVFSVAKTLLDKGANPNEIAYHFTQRRSLASLRILQRVLASLTLCEEAQIAVLSASKEDILSSGAMVSDMDGMVDYGRSLQTVQIAVFAMELEEGIRISLRSKKIDISCVAIAFGGGGHKTAAGFTIASSSLEKSIDKVLNKIKEMGLLHGI